MLWCNVGYVNLMWIKLLMMKLHAQDVYICILCVFTQNWWNIMLLLMNSWLVVVVVAVVRCCCWIVMPWVIIIIELAMNLCCSWGFYEKWVKWWIVFKWCFDFKFYIVLSVFYVHKPINNLWEQIWMLGDQNLGFWVKNGVKTVTTGENSLETRYWRNLSGTFSLSARISLLVKLHSDSIPCFAFLRLFTHLCF